MADKELDELKNALNKLTRDLGGMLRQTPSQARADGVRQRSATRQSGRSDYDAAAEKFNDASGKLTSDFNKSRKMFRKMSETWGNSSNALDDLAGVTYQSSKGLFSFAANAAEVVDSLKRYKSSVAKGIKSQSLLYAQQLQNIRSLSTSQQAGLMDKLADSISTLDDETKRAFKMVNSITGKIRGDLSVDHFANLRGAIGDAHADILENLKDSTFKSIDDLVTAAHKDFASSFGVDDKGTKNRDALFKIAASLEKRGLIHDKSVSVLDKNGDLKRPLEQSKVNFEKLAQEVGRVGGTFKVASAKLDANTIAFSSAFGTFLQTFNSKAAWLAKKDKTLAYLASSAAISQLPKAVSAIYKEVENFNVQYVPKSLWKTQTDGVTKYEQTPEDTIKILLDNKRQIALVGEQSILDSANAFKDFGYTVKQSGPLVASIIETAFAAGFSSDQVGSAIDPLMKNFQSLAAITNITEKDFLKMNTQILEGEGVFERLMGMDKDRRAAYALDILQQHRKYVSDGMSIEQAQELIQIQQKQKMAPIKERLTNAAKLMVAGSMAGMNANEVEDMRNIRSKPITNADEDKRMEAYVRRLSVFKQQDIADGASRGTFGAAGKEAFWEFVSPAMADLEKSVLTHQMAIDNKKNISEKKQDEAVANTKPNDNELYLGISSALNKVFAVLGNPLVSSITGLAIGVVGLAVNVYLLSKSIAGLALSRALSGGGLGGDLGGKSGKPGKAGKAGKAGKVGGLAKSGRIARGGKYAAFAALLGAGAVSAMSDDEDEDEESSTWWESLISALDAASIGSLIGMGVGGVIGGIGGSVVPGAGTVAGAAAGVSLGATLGATLGASGSLVYDYATGQWSKPGAQPPGTTVSGLITGPGRAGLTGTPASGLITGIPSPEAAKSSVFDPIAAIVASAGPDVLADINNNLAKSLGIMSVEDKPAAVKLQTIADGIDAMNATLKEMFIRQYPEQVSELPSLGVRGWNGITSSQYLSNRAP